MGRTIGIDLGTTNTVLAGSQQNKPPDVLITADNARYIPSVVTRMKDAFLVGFPAQNAARKTPANFIYSIKRLMGRCLSDPEVERVKQSVSYRIVSPPGDETADDVRVMIDNIAYSPVQISAEILKKVKADAEVRLGEPVTHAVITVPAYFNDNQKAATREAGRLAGLKVRRILDEPSAAALAFGLELDSNDERTIIVYDLGGGTFDISVISISDGIPVVEATKGDMWLGGNVFDEYIMAYVLNQMEREQPGSKARLQADARFMWMLRDQAEQAKKTLSTPGVNEVEVSVYGALNDTMDVEVNVRLVDFEGWIRPRIEQSLELMNRAMIEASMSPNDITDVLLVGGSTAVPLVRRMLSEKFGDNKIRANVNPMECVALGAALQAQIIPYIMCGCGQTNDDDAEFCSRCRLPLGAMVPQAICPKCGTSNATDAQICSNVACNHVLNMDAPVGNPYGIGLEDDRYEIIIPVGTRYPMANPIMGQFYTTIDNQPFIMIPVYQGENLERASRNAWQGQVLMTIPEEKRGPSGLPIRVGMGIDKDGILTVSVTGQGRLQGVNISVVVDRNQKVAICEKCGHRNPQDAMQCASCDADLVKTGPRQSKICPRCNNQYDKSATVCPRCGHRPPVETPDYLRSLKFQLVLARIACNDLDWIVPDNLLVTLRGLVPRGEAAVERENQSDCDNMTQRLLETWEDTLYHDLAFCMLLSRSDAGTIQLRQEIASAFASLETAVKRSEQTRMRAIIDQILDLAKRITETLDNTTCPHCHTSTPQGNKCQNCGKRLSNTGDIGKGPR